jgi:hypothetical protein
MGTAIEVHHTSAQMAPGHSGQARRPAQGLDDNARACRLSRELRQHIRKCSEQLKTEFAEELTDRALAIEASRLFARLLLPLAGRRGRPRSAPITTALELVRQGVPSAQIPWRVIPGFAQMPRQEQSLRREHLRRGMYMRRKRSAVTKAE